MKITTTQKRSSAVWTDEQIDEFGEVVNEMESVHSRYAMETARMLGKEFGPADPNCHAPMLVYRGNFLNWHEDSEDVWTLFFSNKTGTTGLSYCCSPDPYTWDGFQNTMRKGGGRIICNECELAPTPHAVNHQWRKQVSKGLASGHHPFKLTDSVGEHVENLECLEDDLQLRGVTDPAELTASARSLLAQLETEPSISGGCHGAWQGFRD